MRENIIYAEKPASIGPATVQQKRPRGLLRVVATIPVPIGWTPAAPTMWPSSVGAREFNRRMRVRIRLLAFERGLPESEIKPVIKLDDYELLAKFIERHDLSYDWLFCGCLKGRLRMAKRSRAMPTLFVGGGADA